MKPRLTSLCALVLCTVLHTAHSKYKPPEILVPDRRAQEDLPAGKSKTLKCSAEADPPPRYRWTLNGKPVPDDVIVNDKTGDLTIAEFEDLHEGDYQCFAESVITPENVAVAISPVTTLRKIRQGSEWAPSSLFYVSGTVGDYLKLTCDNPPVSVPKADYSWYLKQGDGAGGQIQPDDRIYIDEAGNLHFLYLETEDESGAKSYKCGSYNSGLGLIKLGSDKNLTVKNAPLSDKKPRNEFHTNTAKFQIYSEAVLECVFSGKPIPSITWYDKTGREITDKKKFSIVDGNHKLIVKDLQETDEGNYTCKGSNTEGVDQAHVFLNVTSGPIWVAFPSSQTVPENKEANITCKARPSVGEREPNPPQWFKNGKPMVVSDTEKFQFRDNSRVLTVQNLNKTTDFLCFHCKVSNDIGYEFGGGCLNIIEPIVITTEPELQQNITKGDIVNLTVIGKTDPDYTLSYRWYFRNDTYHSPDIPPFVVFNETTKQAYINTSALSDEDLGNINGTYIRELYHDIDALNVSIIVTVIFVEPERPTTVVAAVVDPWWIALVIALLILIIVIFLVCVIIKRKNQQGKYPLRKREEENNIDVNRDLADASFQPAAAIADDDEALPIPDLDVSFDYGDDMKSVHGDSQSLLSTGEDPDLFNEDGSFIGNYGGQWLRRNSPHSSTASSY